MHAVFYLVHEVFRKSITTLNILGGGIVTNAALFRQNNKIKDEAAVRLAEPEDHSVFNPPTAVGKKESSRINRGVKSTRSGAFSPSTYLPPIAGLRPDIRGDFTARCARRHSFGHGVAPLQRSSCILIPFHGLFLGAACSCWASIQIWMFR